MVDVQYNKELGYHMIPKVKMQPDLKNCQDSSLLFLWSTTGHLLLSCKAISRFTPCSADYKWLHRITNRAWQEMNERFKNRSEHYLQVAFEDRSSKLEYANYAHQMVHFKALDTTAWELGTPKKHAKKVIFNQGSHHNTGGSGRISSLTTCLMGGSQPQSTQPQSTWHACISDVLSEVNRVHHK